MHAVGVANDVGCDYASGMSDAGNSSDYQRFCQLLDARHACIAIITAEESEAIALVARAAIDRGTSVRCWSYTHGVHDALVEQSDGVADTQHPAAGLYHLITKPQSGIIMLLDMVGHLDGPKAVRLLRDLIETQRRIRGHVVLIDHSEKLPGIIASMSTRFELSLPDDAELKKIVADVVRREHREGGRIDTRVHASTLETIVRNLRGLTRRHAEQIITEVLLRDRRLTDGDVSDVLAHKRRVLHRDGLLEYVESPASLEQIAGMRGLKRWLGERTLTLGPELESVGLQAPRGVLMLGVPGAGKSLSAKAVASAWQRPLLRLDPSVLYDRYIGESERRLREALQQAEAMSPLVLWIDEIEKGFASAASQSVDGGLSQRMFGSLLTWMQEHRAPVFLFATANNIEALPPELLRKGRFDEIFFVDLPTAEVREAVFRIHLSRRNQDVGKFDLPALVEASEGFTGAEIEQAIISALHRALAGKKRLTTAGLLEAVRNSPPLAVTAAERISKLREWARGRCVAAD